MILSKSDLQRYLELDRRALGIRRAKRPPLTGYRVWKFQVALRKHEYYANTGRSLFGRIMKKFWGAVHEIYGVRLGFSIPINVFGPGLRINHYGLIVVNPKARVGAFCDIHQGVNIGEGFGKDEVPEIGDHVYIGPGAKIYGRIRIADRTAVGANAVVIEGIHVGEQVVRAARHDDRRRSGPAGGRQRQSVRALIAGLFFPDVVFGGLGRNVPSACTRICGEETCRLGCP